MNKSILNIELCCFSANGLSELDESIRIELCSNYLEGGLSPSANLFLHIRSLFNNEIVTMIRPRGGDFCYSDIEFQMMKSEILWFKENGADGIVLGLLKPDGTIDKERTSILVELARPIPVTFHRAFDMSVDYCKSLEDIITKIIPKEKYTVKLEALDSSQFPFVLTQPEFMRRMKEMQNTGGNSMFGSMPEMFNLIVNVNHPLIIQILKTKTSKKQENLINQTLDLAKLSQNLLKGEDLNKFINRSLNMIK